jgi:hypothetical protein
MLLNREKWMKNSFNSFSLRELVVVMACAGACYDMAELWNMRRIIRARNTVPTVLSIYSF